MVVTALTSLFIHEIRLIGAFSPIHLISIGTLVSLFFAVKQAREGDIRNHQRSMKATYIGGMGIAGAMSFTPGRRMYEALIEPTISKFSSGNFESMSLFDGSWQLPILSVVVLVINVFRKPVFSFLSFK